MARKKYSELTAGIFVLAAVAVILGIVLWLGASNLFKSVSQRAFFYVNATDGDPGLKEGGAITYGGSEIGRIAEKRRDAAAGKTYYVGDITQGDVKVYADANSRVVTGLVGDSSLAILWPGSGARGLADQKNPVRIIGGLDQAMGDIASAAGRLRRVMDQELDSTRKDAVMAKVKDILDQIKAATTALADEMNAVAEKSIMAKAHRSFDDVNAVTASLKGETDVKNDKAMLAKLSHSVDEVNGILDDARPKLERTMTAVAETAERISAYTKKDVAEILATLREVNTQVLKISKDFAEVSGQTRQVVVMNRENIDDIIGNMALVSADLKATAKEVRRNPWRLLYQPDNKELRSQNIYDAARNFSSGAEQMDQAVARLSSLAKAHPEGIKADDPEVQKVRKDLQETFEKFKKVEDSLWKEMTK